MPRSELQKPLVRGHPPRRRRPAGHLHGVHLKHAGGC